MIVYVSKNLLWTSRLAGAATAAGVPAKGARDAAGLRARLAEAPGVVGAVIVDLDGVDDPLEAVRGAVEARGSGRVRVVAAFGPHVREDLLEGARAAGADVVLARGAFERRMGELMREWGA